MDKTIDCCLINEKVIMEKKDLLNIYLQIILFVLKQFLPRNILQDNRLVVVLVRNFDLGMNEQSIELATKFS